MVLVDYLMRRGAIGVNCLALNWRDALIKGVDFLVTDGKATWDYFDAIVRNVEENGPYFVLMPGVALPHARPEEGAIATGFSLITLATPVDFGSPENDPISILLTFCSADPTAHVKTAMAEAVSLFENENNVEELMQANNVDEIKDVLKKIKVDE